MPGQIDINQIFSDNAFSGIDELNAKLNKSIENLRLIVEEGEKVGVAFQNVKTNKDLVKATEQQRKNTEQLTAEQKEAAKTVKQLETAKAKLAQADSKEAQELARVKAEQQKKNKETRDAIKLEQAEKDAVNMQVKSIADLQKQTSALTAVRRKQDLTTEAGVKKYNALTKQIDANNKKLKDYDKQIGVNNRNVGNYKDDIISAFNQMGLAATPFGRIITQTSKATKLLTASTTENTASTETNVAATTESTVATTAQSAARTKGAASAKTLTTANKVLRASMLAIPVLAIVAAFVSLVQFFKRTEEGASKLQRVLAPFKVLFGNIGDIVRDVGEKIFNAFSSPKEAVVKLWETIKTNIVNRITGVADQFKALGKIVKSALKLDFDGVKEGALELAEATTQTITGVDELGKKVQQGLKNAANGVKSFVDETKKETNILKQLEDDQLALQKRQRDAEVENAKITEQVAALRIKAKKEDIYSDEERLKFLDEAIALEGKKLTNDLAIKEEQLRIAKTRASLSDSDKETLDEVARLEAEVYNARASFQKAQLRLESERQTTIKKVNADNITAIKEGAAATSAALGSMTSDTDSLKARQQEQTAVITQGYEEQKAAILLQLDGLGSAEIDKRKELTAALETLEADKVQRLAAINSEDVLTSQIAMQKEAFQVYRDRVDGMMLEEKDKAALIEEINAQEAKAIEQIVLQRYDKEASALETSTQEKIEALHQEGLTYEQYEAEKAKILEDFEKQKQLLQLTNISARLENEQLSAEEEEKLIRQAADIKLALYEDELQREQQKRDEAIKQEQEKQDAIAQARGDAYKLQTEQITANQQEQVMTVIDALKNKEISEEEYYERLKEIDEQAQQAQLDAYIANLEDILANEELTAEERIKIENKVRDAKIQASQEAMEQQKADSQEVVDAALNQLGEVASVASGIGSAVNEVYDAQLDHVEASYDKKLELAEGDAYKTMTLEREKAKEVATIQRKQAIIDRSTSLFSIAINTAQSISKVAAEAGLAAPILIPFYTALGIAQAAAVLAEPLPTIPAFATGTQDAPGGLAVVGEKGQELITDRRGGKAFLSPDKPTLLSLEKHDKVYTSEETKKILEDKETRNKAFTSEDKEIRNKAFTSEDKEIRNKAFTSEDKEIRNKAFTSENKEIRNKAFTSEEAEKNNKFILTSLEEYAKIFTAKETEELLSENPVKMSNFVNNINRSIMYNTGGGNSASFSADFGETNKLLGKAITAIKRIPATQVNGNINWERIERSNGYIKKYFG